MDTMLAITLEKGREIAKINSQSANRLKKFWNENDKLLNSRRQTIAAQNKTKSIEAKLEAEKETSTLLRGDKAALAKDNRRLKSENKVAKKHRLVAWCVTSVVLIYEAIRINLRSRS